MFLIYWFCVRSNGHKITYVIAVNALLDFHKLLYAVIKKITTNKIALPCYLDTFSFQTDFPNNILQHFSKF